MRVPNQGNIVLVEQRIISILNANAAKQRDEIGIERLCRYFGWAVVSM